ncbi:hypothetical protein ACFWP5_28355 [Streptomyces sp. NPDC058469]|uniref:hypothetical protein n=1 Tax=Streptomyces sp. NPDC058469 TaxID=3346514 RepID=UPI0036587AB8
MPLSGKEAHPRNTKEARRTSSTETSGATGAPDKDYNLVRYVEACLSNALRLETYIADAERDKGTEVGDPFRKARADSRTGAELGRRLLGARWVSGAEMFLDGWSRAGRR